MSVFIFGHVCSSLYLYIAFWTYSNEFQSRNLLGPLLHSAPCVLLNVYHCLWCWGWRVATGGGRRNVTRSGGEPRLSDRGQRVAETPSSKSSFRMATSRALSPSCNICCCDCLNISQVCTFTSKTGYLQAQAATVDYVAVRAVLPA